MTLRFVFTLDACNFCFWPAPDYEYPDLCKSIKKMLLENPAADLSDIDPEDAHLLKGLPQQQERLRCIQQVFRYVKDHYDSSFTALVTAGQQSVPRLLELITRIPCFQDHCVYKGRQVFFYKRAQILVGDIFGIFGGKGLGAFQDMGQLTMFPDYRVPQILRHYKVLSYSHSLD
jgi:hypothetical protein